MNQNTFSISQVISEGWNIFSQNAGLVLKFLFTSFVAMFAFQLVIGLIGASEDSLLTLIGSIASYIFNIFISIGLIKVMFKIVRKEPVEMATLFSGKDQILMYFLVSILLSLIIGFGFVFLIIPGIYLMLRFIFVPYLLLDKTTLSTGELFSVSTAMSKGNKLNLFFYGIVIFILNMVGIIPLGLGLLVTIPISFFSFIVIYEKLQVRKDGPADMVPSTTAPGTPEPTVAQGT